MTKIIQYAAALTPHAVLNIKKTGKPVTSAMLPQISCRFVKFHTTLVLMCVRSLGTETTNIQIPP